MDDHTLAQIAPSGDFGNTLTINCDNPLLSGRSSQRHDLRSRDRTSITGFLGNFPLAAGAPYNTVGTASAALRRSTSSTPIRLRATPTTRPSSSCFAVTPKAARVSPTSRTPAIAACSARAAISATSGRTTLIINMAGPTTRRSIKNEFSVVSPDQGAGRRRCRSPTGQSSRSERRAGLPFGARQRPIRTACPMTSSARAVRPRRRSII